MPNYDIIFAGFGGQGILFTGKVAAYAGLIDGNEVSWLPSYGPEMRGGTANCSVCIANKPLGSPLVTAPNILMAMNGPSFNRFINTLVPGGKVFIDSTLVNCSNIRDDVEIFALPATQLAIDNQLGGIANIIMLGKMMAETGFATLSLVKQALEKCIPANRSHLLENNMRAIEIGMSL